MAPKRQQSDQNHGDVSEKLMLNLRALTVLLHEQSAITTGEFQSMIWSVDACWMEQRSLASSFPLPHMDKSAHNWP